MLIDVDEQRDNEVKSLSYFKETLTNPDMILDGLDDNQRKMLEHWTSQEGRNTDDEKNKIAFSMFMADKLGEDLTWTYNNYDELSNGWFGKKISAREANQRLH